MSGVVTETAPTSTTPIGGATVTIVDGPNAGIVGEPSAPRLVTATTDGNGFYILRDLVAGPFTLRVSRSGFETRDTPVGLTGDRTLNVQLRPNLQILDNQIADTVNAGSPRCPDFFTTTALPCQQYSIATHHNGRLDAVLTWTGTANTLQLALLKAPRANPEDRLVIARFGPVRGREEISIDLTAGVQYFVHVLYDSGSTVQPFTLRVIRPN